MIANDQRLDRRRAAVMALICCLAYLPFLDKGITYDDVVYLDYAERLSFNPVRCQVDDYVFQGAVLDDFVVFESTHPPLVPYYLKLVQQLVGDNLLLLHLAFLPFLILATLALGELVQRLTGRSPFLALGLTLGPLLFPAATWLMTDMPLVAFWCLAVVAMLRLFNRDADTSPWPAMLLVALLILAAVFTAYQGLGLLALLGLFAWRRGQWRPALIVSALVGVPFVLWLLLVYQAYGIFPYFAPPRETLSIATEVHKGLAWDNMWLKARLVVVYSGAGLFFYALVGLVREWRQAPLWLGWGGVLAFALFPEMTPWGRFYPWLLAAAGLYLLACAAYQCLQLRQASTSATHNALLLLWLVGFAGFQVGLAAFAAPRYILLMIVPLWLLFLKWLPRDPTVHLRLVFATAATVGLGLLVGFADKDYAHAQQLQHVDGLDAYGSLYVAGEKGVRYSAEQLGHHYYYPGIDEDVTYLLVTNEVDRIPISKSLFDHAEEVTQFPRPASLPLRVMSRSNQAGFYIHTRGLLPFTWGSGPLENYVLYRVFHELTVDYLGSETVDNKASGYILPETPVTQDFTSARDGLSRIGFYLATSNRVNHSTLGIRLHRLNDNGEIAATVFETTLDAATLKDNNWEWFDFPPQASAGHTYRAELWTPDATPGTAIQVWTNAAAEGQYRYGQAVRSGLLGFRAFRGPSHGGPSSVEPSSVGPSSVEPSSVEPSDEQP